MLPLHGVRIIDLSRALAGPYCTALLADLGAEIIKVESLRGGDPARSWPPFHEDRSLYFDATNRNKRSVALDLYSPAGTAVLDRLLAGADALVENFKPGTLAAMGYPPERLAELNPDLVVASITGYGDTGPLAARAGLDQVIQAVSGLTSVTGPVGGDGYRVGVPIVDITSGMNAAVGLLAALLGRARGVATTRVSTSLYETALGLSAFQGQSALTLGVAPPAPGNDHPSITPYGAYPTATEPLVLAASTDAHWRALCTILGRPDLPEDPRFATGRARTAARAELNAEISAALQRRPAAEWIEEINAAGIPCGPINDYVQALNDPHTDALGMVHTAERPDGSVLRLLRGPLSIDGVASTVRQAPPALGADGAAVLHEAGFTREGIDALVRDGVLADSPTSAAVPS